MSGPSSLRLRKATKFLYRIMLVAAFFAIGEGIGIIGFYLWVDNFQVRLTATCPTSLEGCLIAVQAIKSFIYIPFCVAVLAEQLVNALNRRKEKEVPDSRCLDLSG
jgi:hypothetical protein